MVDTSVLFVCLGNICRSPTAEGIFRHQLELAGLADQVTVDSAGTGDWHTGSAPDPRARAAALSRGYDIGQFKARPVDAEDFTRFDHIIAMDLSNQSNLQALAASAMDSAAQQKIRLMLSFASNCNLTEVPDPYYGGENGFNQVIDILESACSGLLAAIRSKPAAV